MRNIPPSIEPDQIYRSDELAEFWHISKDNRQKWYRGLKDSFQTTTAKVGDHFILTGRDALASLAQCFSDGPAPASRKKSSDS